MRLRSGLLPLALLMTALTGCDTLLGNDEAGPVVGTWVAQVGDWTEYVVITDDSVTVFTRDAGESCFGRTAFERVSRDGRRFALRLAGTATTLNVLIERVDDQLRIRNETQPEDDWVVYAGTEEDAAALDACVGGGASAAVPCAELTPLTFGAAVNGELAATDPAGPAGSHFDVYGLQLDAEADVEISLSSAAFDPLLWLYEGDGTLIASNDDAGADGLDAGLVLTLTAGCYRVEATSFAPGATGPYTVTADGS